MPDKPTVESLQHEICVLRKQRARDRKRWFVVWIITLLLSALSGYLAFHAGQRAGHADVSAQRLNDASFGVCHRLQVVRDGENSLDARVYLILSQVVSANLRNPTAGSEQRLAEYRALAAASRYRPATNCDEAVQHPLEYKPPKPIPMNQVSDAIVRTLAGLPADVGTP